MIPSLTPAQKRALSRPSANMQLIACAGSGKTEVVAQRITTLVTPKAQGGAGLKPGNIVAFTFTDKAAAELKDRVIDRCRTKFPDIIGLADMYIGTIHGFCLDLLKTEVPKFSKYDVLNEIQQRLFIDRSSIQSGLRSSSTLVGRQLRRYVDTGVYIQALSILRESTLNPRALRGNSVLAGLAAYRTLLSGKAYLDYSAIMEDA